MTLPPAAGERTAHSAALEIATHLVQLPDIPEGERARQESGFAVRAMPVSECLIHLAPGRFAVRIFDTDELSGWASDGIIVLPATAEALDRLMSGGATAEDMADFAGAEPGNDPEAMEESPEFSGETGAPDGMDEEMSFAGDAEPEAEECAGDIGDMASPDMEAEPEPMEEDGMEMAEDWPAEATGGLGEDDPATGIGDDVPAEEWGDDATADTAEVEAAASDESWPESGEEDGETVGECPDEAGLVAEETAETAAEDWGGHATAGTAEVEAAASDEPWPESGEEDGETVGECPDEADLAAEETAETAAEDETGASMEEAEDAPERDPEPGAEDAGPFAGSDGEEAEIEASGEEEVSLAEDGASGIADPDEPDMSADAMDDGLDAELDGAAADEVADGSAVTGPAATGSPALLPMLLVQLAAHMQRVIGDTEGEICQRFDDLEVAIVELQQALTQPPDHGDPATPYLPARLDSGLAELLQRLDDGPAVAPAAEAGSLAGLETAIATQHGDLAAAAAQGLGLMDGIADSLATAQRAHADAMADLTARLDGLVSMLAAHAAAAQAEHDDVIARLDALEAGLAQGSGGQAAPAPALTDEMLQDFQMLLAEARQRDRAPRRAG